MKHEIIKVDALATHSNDEIKEHTARMKLAHINAPMTSASAFYAKTIAGESDWIIAEQPVRTLSIGLTDMIGLKLRDEGNQLIEETRLINNSFVGLSFHQLEAMLTSDLTIENLKSRLLVWGETVTNKVTYKLRHRSKKEPLLAYEYLLDLFLRHLDSEIAFGRDRMFQVAWTVVLDQIGYIIMKSFLVDNRNFYYHHLDFKTYEFRGPLASESKGRVACASLLNVYGVEIPRLFVQFALPPLLEHLNNVSPLVPVEKCRSDYYQYLGDITEAMPYLYQLDSNDRYIFQIPNSDYYCGFKFMSANGVGDFFIAANGEEILTDMKSRIARTGLEISWDGTMSAITQPWITLSRMCGVDDAWRISCWFLEQVHTQIVLDYLKVIENIDITTSRTEAITSSEDNTGEFKYVEWVRQANSTAPAIDEVLVPAMNSLGVSKSLIPQIRRTLFFKLLELCDVRIEPGKGSEIKLLRDGKHPFRLGNHYGPNPTVPTFLASNILQRLEITHDEWSAAMSMV